MPTAEVTLAHPGEHIAEALRQLGRTPQDLATALGKRSVDTVYKQLKESNPRAETLQAYAQALNGFLARGDSRRFSATSLLAGPDPVPPAPDSDPQAGLAPAPADWHGVVREIVQQEVRRLVPEGAVPLARGGWGMHMLEGTVGSCGGDIVGEAERVYVEGPAALGLDPRRDWYTMPAMGESMARSIPPGSRLLIYLAEEAHPGDVVIALDTRTGEQMVRRLVADGEPMLVSEYLDPRRMLATPLSAARILAVVEHILARP